MTTMVLLLLQSVAAIAGAGLWLATGFSLGSPAARPSRRERLVVLALATGGTISRAAAALVTALLAGRGWWCAGEKIVVGLPFQVIGLVAGLLGLAWWLRGTRVLLARTLVLGGAYAMTAAVVATWLVGYPPQPVAAGVMLAAVALATGLTWALLAHRGRRTVAGFAGLLAVLLVGGLGWSWLSDTAAPRIEAAGTHVHAASATPGAEASAVPVTELRTPVDAPGELHTVELIAARHDVTLASGETIEAWGFGGDGVAGPELRVTEGEL